MEKTGLVLGGGGAKGSYQMGAWKAFRELDLSFDLIVGTSIGALNGALMAAQDFDGADRLWNTIEDKQIFPDCDGRRLEEVRQLENPLDLLRFAARDAIPQGSFSAEKLEGLVRERIDEEKVRSSPIDFGLVTVEFPAMRPRMPMKCESPEGALYRWLMASAACFPVFSPYEIDGTRYLDGGYYDNLPVGLAANQGASRIVAVDLDGVGLERRARREKIEELIRIEPRWDLGAIFDFDQNAFARNRMLGYYDTLKAFGRMEGFAYSFRPGELARNAERLSFGTAELQKHLSASVRKPIARTLSLLAQDDALEMLASGSWEWDRPQMLCRAAELTGAVFGLAPDRCYSFEEYNQKLLREFEKRPRFLTLSSDPKALIAALAEAVEPHSVASMIAQYLAKPAEESSLPAALLPPREYTAACYLKLLLDDRRRAR